MTYTRQMFGPRGRRRRATADPLPDKPAFLDWDAPDPNNPDDANMGWWQEEMCALCGRIWTLVLDHDHRTGLTRGYLCNSCNVLEGQGTPTPAFDMWRDGCNPAAVFGWDRVYLNRAGYPVLSISIKDPDYEMVRARILADTDLDIHGTLWSYDPSQRRAELDWFAQTMEAEFIRRRIAKRPA